MDKLTNYTRITELDKIKYGSYIRWMKNGVLTKGMFICDIIITDEGVIIRGKTPQGKFLNIKMENCIYQKMTPEEITISNVLKTIKRL